MVNRNYNLRIYLKNVIKTPGEPFKNVLSYRGVSLKEIDGLVAEHKKENVLKTEVRPMNVGHPRKKKKV